MSRRINNFSNGGFIEFDSGCFDGWCVFVTKPGTRRFAPTDVQYFTRIKEISEKFGPQKVYDDFVVIYNRTTKNIDPKVFVLILTLSRFYDDNSAEIELWFNVLYAGMIAEENKENAILKKRIKRLGVHQVLIDGISPEKAAVFSKGKKWKELDEIMRSKGF
jgi:predicted RND superfamily exporter protein